MAKLTDIAALLTAADSPEAFTVAVTGGKLTLTLTNVVADSGEQSEALLYALAQALAAQENANRLLISAGITDLQTFQIDGVASTVNAVAPFNRNLFSLSYPSDDNAIEPAVPISATIAVAPSIIGNYSTAVETVPVITVV